MTDQELLSLLRQRDPGAFKELRKLYPMCRKRILELGVSEEDSKDIFQDSIIILYEKTQRADFTLTSKISTFLYGICQNKALEVQRKKRKDDAFKEHMAKEVALNETEENESTLPDEEQIRQALHKLGPPCREILGAFYYHLASIKEISEKLGYKNENTARQAKYKCMQRLKETLSKPIS